MEPPRLVLRPAGHAAPYFPASELSVDAPAPRAIREVLSDLGVPAGLVMAALVNGERRSLDERVMNGDEVVLLAPPAGG